MTTSETQLHKVFVYGSFQEPDVHKIMLDRTPEIISATLPGFKRFRLKGRLYPCIVPSETGEVHGKILMGITDEELVNLDTVEGDEYERVTVGAVREDNSEKLAVKTYIWVNKDDPDMYGEWDFEEWKSKHKAKFIESFKAIMEWKKIPQEKRGKYIDVLRENVGDATSS
ncbi:hypothetical protein AALP_AA8G308000 [Arabis alpina]|uniref:Putative gamma-glutamylcyclotransferase n=1 Tax=Arabis alpina TaxID=50452 RepID=A0A087GAJ7_ARAAL|nr:hypothetical protein AALP_AA8G308000 [Arabis alpina]